MTDQPKTWLDRAVAGEWKSGITLAGAFMSFEGERGLSSSENMAIVAPMQVGLVALGNVLLYIVERRREEARLKAENARLSTPLRCDDCDEGHPLLLTGPRTHIRPSGLFVPCVHVDVAERNAEIAGLRAEVAALLKQQERDMETIWRIQQKVGNAGLCIPCVLGHDKFKLGSDGRLLHDDSAHDESALWGNGGVDMLCCAPNAEAVAALVHEVARLTGAGVLCSECGLPIARGGALLIEGRETKALHSCTPDSVVEENAALRALVQEGEWATNAEECPWCDWASPVHRPDCKAAKVMGWRTE